MGTTGLAVFLWLAAETGCFVVFPESVENKNQTNIHADTQISTPRERERERERAMDIAVTIRRICTLRINRIGWTDTDTGSETLIVAGMIDFRDNPFLIQQST